MTVDQLNALVPGTKLVSKEDPFGHGLGWKEQGKIVTFHKFVSKDGSPSCWIQIEEYLKFPIYSEHAISAYSFDIYDPVLHADAIQVTDEWVRDRHRRRLAACGGGSDVGISENI